MATPIPDGRGRWRLTLHHRQWGQATWQGTFIAELTDARSRSLSQKWNQAAELQFTMEGHSSQSSLIQELATEVIAWRWDEAAGKDQPMFRGCIDHSEDQISEQTTTTNFVAHDYFAMFDRRILTVSFSMVTSDQDDIVSALMTLANQFRSSSGTSMWPGSYTPLNVYRLCNPDGTARGASGQNRDRTYTANSPIGQMISELAAVQGGFDFSVWPLANAQVSDVLAIYYPRQGVDRLDVPLQYGSTVSSLTRTVSSADYANYVRSLGNNGSADPNAPQFYSEVWNSDANNVTVNPVGLWCLPDNAPDVTIQSTLNQQAQGNLNFHGLLVPSYTLALRPGAYRYGYPNMGDNCPLYIKAGRLNVQSVPPSGGVRVLGIDYAIGDDGQEDVSLTLGRPLAELADLFTKADSNVDALTRR
jgi:hypothetical protein